MYPLCLIELHHIGLPGSTIVMRASIINSVKSACLYKMAKISPQEVIFWTVRYGQN